MSGSSGSGEDEKFTTTDNGHILIRRELTESSTQMDQ